MENEIEDLYKPEPKTDWEKMVTDAREDEDVVEFNQEVIDEFQATMQEVVKTLKAFADDVVEIMRPILDNKELMESIQDANRPSAYEPFILDTKDEEE